MAVYAHPDDEQGVSGSFIKYGRMGVNTTLVVATRGEAGEIAPGTDATPETLGDAREREMRCAAELMEVKNLYFLDYCDSGMAGTPMNEDPLSFHQASLMNVVEKVVRIIRQQRPQVLLTFDAWGGYGHPDHIKIHQATTTAYYLAGDPRAFLNQIMEEGLRPWTPQKLYYGAFSREMFEKWIKLAFPNGEQWDVAQGFIRRAMPEAAITTRIDVQEFARLKMQALNCHATQLGPNTFFARVPEEARIERMTVESFVLAESRDARAESETDLFEGVKA
ncbi:MAG: PIG-L family deacetylase [Anaerolineae bacterium]